MEQVQLLDQKIKQAVRLIQQLREENQHLKDKLGEYERRVKDLEDMLVGLRSTQKALEDGVLHALAELDRIQSPLESGGEPPLTAHEAAPRPSPSFASDSPTEEPTLDERSDSNRGGGLDIF